MHAILDFRYFVSDGLLTVMVWIVIIYVILSWLTAFNVINQRNPAVYSLSRTLESVARPILRPIQRLLPAMGGMDFSPVILFLVIGGVQRYLLPALFGWLHTLVGGPISI